MELRLRKRRRCAKGFCVCRPCDRGRRFCSEECGSAADKENRRRAHRRYRKSRDGKKQHRDEERDRRGRKRDFVGDKCRAGKEPLGIVRCQEVAMPADKPVTYTTVTLVYPPSLESEARQMVGFWVRCVKCHRAGPVVALRRKASRRRW